MVLCLGLIGVCFLIVESRWAVEVIVRSIRIDANHVIHEVHLGNRNFLYYPLYFKGGKWHRYSIGHGASRSFGFEETARWWFKQRRGVRA